MSYKENEISIEECTGLTVLIAIVLSVITLVIIVI